MASNRYRIITAETFQRIPMDGIVGTPEEQRVSNDGTLYMVERAEGFTSNDRWITHEEAIVIIGTPEWDCIE